MYLLISFYLVFWLDSWFYSLYLQSCIDLVSLNGKGQMLKKTIQTL